MSPQQVIGQYICSYFFGCAGLRKEAAEVVPFPLFRSLLIIEVVKTRRNTTLESQRKCGGEQGKNNQYIMKACQKRGHQNNRHDVARKPEDGPRQVSRSPRYIPFSSCQTIVPVGVVKVTQVDPRRLLQQTALGFQFSTPDKKIPAVSHIGAHGALHG